MNFKKALEVAKSVKNKNKSENILKNKISKENSFKISFLSKLGLFIPVLDMFVLKRAEKKFIKYCDSNKIEVSCNDLFHIKINVFLLSIASASLFFIPFSYIFTTVIFVISYILSFALACFTIGMFRELKHKTHQIMLDAHNINTSESILSSSDFTVLTKCLDKQYFSEWMVKNDFKITYGVLDSMIEDLQKKLDMEKAGQIWESTIKNTEIIKS